MWKHKTTDHFFPELLCLWFFSTAMVILTSPGVKPKNGQCNSKLLLRHESGVRKRVHRTHATIIAGENESTPGSESHPGLRCHTELLVHPPGLSMPPLSWLCTCCTAGAVLDSSSLGQLSSESMSIRKPRLFLPFQTKETPWHPPQHSNIAYS